MKKILVAVVLMAVFLAASVHAYDNGVGLKPALVCVYGRSHGGTIVAEG